MQYLNFLLILCCKNVHKMKNFDHFSPNFDKKIRLKKQIQIIVFHYTGMQSRVVSLKRLCDPNSKVSCHYLFFRKLLITEIMSRIN